MYNQQPLPFYMAYPMPHMLDMEQEQEREASLMKSYYPQVAMRIQEYVERECDKMEYEGSMMYDEYPDKHMMEQLSAKIEEKLDQTMVEQPMEAQPMEVQPMEGQSMEAQNWNWNYDNDYYRDRYDRYDRYRPGRGYGELINVLLFNEIFRRRCRRGRCRRYF